MQLSWPEYPRVWALPWKG